MRLLFEMDARNYDRTGSAFVRPSARSIILRAGKIAMVHSLKYDYYKFPGGGIEPGETREEAVIRETLEETGLRVLPESIREYGYVHRIEKGKQADLFIQDNYYYLCEAAGVPAEQHLDSYEAEERFTLEWVTPQAAILANRGSHHDPKDRIELEREAGVLELLVKEGYWDQDA